MKIQLAVVFLCFGCIILVLVGTGEVTEDKTPRQELSDVYRDRADHVKNTGLVTEDKRAGQELPEVYRERAEHVKNTCEKYKKEISARYRKFWPNENYNSVLGRADVLLNKNVGFLWCRVPKAASELDWSFHKEMVTISYFLRVTSE